MRLYRTLRLIVLRGRTERRVQLLHRQWQISGRYAVPDDEEEVFRDNAP